MRSKTCRFCETRIPRGASVCPYCFKYQWNALVPRVLAVALVVAVTGGVIGWKYGILRGEMESSTRPQPVEIPVFMPEKEGIFPLELYDKQTVDEQAVEVEPVNALEKKAAEAKKAEQPVSKKPQAKKNRSWKKRPVEPPVDKTRSVETAPARPTAVKAKAVESAREEAQRETTVSKKPEAQTAGSEAAEAEAQVDKTSPIGAQAETSSPREQGGAQTAKDEAVEVQVDTRPPGAQVEETPVPGDSGDRGSPGNPEEQ